MRNYDRAALEKAKRVILPKQQGICWLTKRAVGL